MISSWNILNILQGIDLHVPITQRSFDSERRMRRWVRPLDLCGLAPSITRRPSSNCLPHTPLQGCPRHRAPHLSTMRSGEKHSLSRFGATFAILRLVETGHSNVTGRSLLR